MIDPAKIIEIERHAQTSAASATHVKSAFRGATVHLKHRLILTLLSNTVKLPNLEKELYKMKHTTTYTH